MVRIPWSVKFIDTINVGIRFSLWVLLFVFASGSCVEFVAQTRRVDADYVVPVFEIYQRVLQLLMKKK
jgi:hypothetical protein